MITYENLIETPTEGYDVRNYDVVVDIGNAVWDPDVDEVFIEFNHELRRAFIKRRRIIVNPRDTTFFR